MRPLAAPGAMVQTTADPKSPIVWRPFGLPSSPSSPSTLAGSRSNSWNARDEVIRRFSEPAVGSDILKTDRFIKRAAEAYEDAVVKLRQTLKTADVSTILSPSNSTKPELYKVALSIQKDQNDVLDRRKMAKFIDVLDHYSGCFDVLSQCDFSYMTLIWGVLKFGLIMSKNHHDMLYKFTDMMVEVGLNLSRVELYRHIFPTGRMLELVSELYAAVIEFLHEIVVYAQKKTIKKYFTSFSKPFDIQHGRLVERIRRLQQCIEDDARAGALVLQLVQTRSLARHRVDLSLRREHYETTLRDIHQGQTTPLFLEIKKTLFHGFEIEAGYHEELAATFKFTSSPAWAHWLSIEQQYIPSRFSHETTIVQAECDAPDAGTCLQWVAQARSESPHVVSAYLLWARGMTAQSAIASILFQMLQQRPQALSTAGLTMKSFHTANSSLPKLWSLFLHMVRALGGLMVYISIGSVGQEEFGIVQKFVDLCSKWDGPPINVVLIHPFDENFAKVEDCIDLDEKYDVHPSLTTTDALHHVVLLKLKVHNELSETVQGVLWEALWREVRYAVIGIALTQAIEEIKNCAEILIGEKECEQRTRSLWLSTVSTWTKNRRAVNTMREQIQRHLDLVDLHLPADVRLRLDRMVETAIGDGIGDEGEVEAVAKGLRDGNSKPLPDDQRNDTWKNIQDAIRPGTFQMFSYSIKGLMDEVLTEYLDDLPETQSEARSSVHELHRSRFGWNGKWKQSFLDSKDPIEEGIVASIDVGFVGVVDTIMNT